MWSLNVLDANVVKKHGTYEYLFGYTCISSEPKTSCWTEAIY